MREHLQTPAEVRAMHSTVGLVLVALVLGQVSADLSGDDVKPMYFKDAIAKAAPTTSERIASGWEAEPGQLPHQASLRIISADGSLLACGASVVHRSWLLSSAHCASGRLSMIVRAGLVHIDQPEYILETREWFVHPSFDQESSQPVQPNDISIIKLQHPVVYSANLKAIRVQPTADAFKSYANEMVVASGWGKLWTDGIYPDSLQWVYLTAISNAECRSTYGSTIINDNVICARYYNVTSQSICQGDSGGPLVYSGGDGIPTLVGIASFVAGGEFGCHSHHPAGFIRPGPFISWLNEITGLDFNNLEEEEMTEAPTTTTTLAPMTTTSAPTTTTSAPVTTTLAPIDPESEGTKAQNKLIVKVKVKVKVNKKLKKKIKVKCLDKF